MSTARNTHSQIHTHIVGALQDNSSVSFTELRDCVSSPASYILLPSPLCFLLLALTFFTVRSHPFPWPEQRLLLLIHQTFMSPTSNGVPIHINRISFSATSKCFLSSPENLSYYNAIIPSTDKLFPTSQLSFPAALCPKSDVS